MPEKINKMPEFYMIYAKKITKFPNFTQFLPEKNSFCPNLGGNCPLPSISYTYDLTIVKESCNIH